MSHNWKNILVSSSMTIKDALKVIDSEALKFAMVVDAELHLLGTLTDGDIRRALIKGKSLSLPISEIMTSTPKTAQANSSRKELLELMEKNELFSIPLIENGVVVGLETLHQVVQKAKYDNPVFLMAGGFGTRLRPLTKSCPKPLLDVGGRPILETVLLSFIKSGFNLFYISTHYLPQMIMDYFGSGEKWGVSIQYVHETEPLGTGGALGLLPKDRPDLPVIVMNGDVLTKINFEKLLNFHIANKANATMCVREYEYQVPYGVVVSDGNKILSMEEKPIQRFHVNAGIYVVGSEIINSVKCKQRIDMPSLIENNLDNKTLVFPFYDYWLDIGRMEDYKRAQSDIYSLGLLD